VTRPCERHIVSATSSGARDGHASHEENVVSLTSVSASLASAPSIAAMGADRVKSLRARGHSMPATRSLARDQSFRRTR
jgi:hypothetical protein